MTQLVLERATASILNGVSLALDPGITYVLGTPEDGTRELLQVVAGALSLRSGSFQLDGADSRRVPAVRRRLGVVFEDEAPFEAATVRDALEGALHGKRARENPAELLRRLGLESWLARRCAQLNAVERRTVALAAALAGEPAVLAVAEPHGPFSVPTTTLRERYLDAARRGAILLFVTRHPGEVSRLAGATIVLQRGRVVRQIPLGTPSEWLPGTSAVFDVRCQGARMLASRLLEHPATRTVHYDAAFSEQLSVMGSDTNRTALAVLECVRTLDLRLESLVARAPSLEQVQAAAVAVVRAAYDNAYRASRQPSAAAGAPSQLAQPPQAARTDALAPGGEERGP